MTSPPCINIKYIFLDEGPETGDESDEDIIRNYLPGDNHDIIRNYEPHHNIPAINITLHSANTNHVLGKKPSSAYPVLHHYRCKFHKVTTVTSYLLSNIV